MALLLFQSSLRMKGNLLFYLLITAYTLSLGTMNKFISVILMSFSSGHAIECRACRKRDASCVFAQDPIRHQCANTSDHCYTWFSRRGIECFFFSLEKFDW